MRRSVLLAKGRYRSAMKKARKISQAGEEGEHIARLQRQQAEGKKKKIQGSSQQMYMATLGRVADGYLPGEAGVSFGEVVKRGKNGITNLYATHKIKKDLATNDPSAPKFKLRDFCKGTAAAIYKSFYEAKAANDPNAIRQLTTNEQFNRIKVGLKPAPKGLKRVWKGNVLNAKALTVRYIPVDEMEVNFSQICVRIKSEQKMSLVDPEKDDEIVKETGTRDVSETWVFERLTNKPNEKWRWCGELPLAVGEQSLLQLTQNKQ